MKFYDLFHTCTNTLGGLFYNYGQALLPTTTLIQKLKAASMQNGFENNIRFPQKFVDRHQKIEITSVKV